MPKPIILTISADPAQSGSIQRCLEAAGYEVLEMGQDENLLAALKQVHPQLALLDWGDPGRSALDVTRMIRSSRRFARLPIILTGMEISGDDKVTALEAGVDLCVDGVLVSQGIRRPRALSPSSGEQPLIASGAHLKSPFLLLH